MLSASACQDIAPNFRNFNVIVELNERINHSVTDILAMFKFLFPKIFKVLFHYRDDFSLFF